MHLSHTTLQTTSRANHQARKLSSQKNRHTYWPCTACITPCGAELWHQIAPCVLPCAHCSGAVGNLHRGQWPRLPLPHTVQLAMSLNLHLHAHYITSLPYTYWARAQLLESNMPCQLVPKCPSHSLSSVPPINAYHKAYTPTQQNMQP